MAFGDYVNDAQGRINSLFQTMIQSRLAGRQMRSDTMRGMGEGIRGLGASISAKKEAGKERESREGIAAAQIASQEKMLDTQLSWQSEENKNAFDREWKMLIQEQGYDWAKLNQEQRNRLQELRSKYEEEAKLLEQQGALEENLQRLRSEADMELQALVGKQQQDNILLGYEADRNLSEYDWGKRLEQTQMQLDASMAEAKLRYGEEAGNVMNKFIALITEVASTAGSEGWIDPTTGVLQWDVMKSNPDKVRMAFQQALAQSDIRDPDQVKFMTDQLETWLASSGQGEVPEPGKERGGLGGLVGNIPGSGYEATRTMGEAISDTVTGAVSPSVTAMEEAVWGAPEREKELSKARTVNAFRDVFDKFSYGQGFTKEKYEDLQPDEKDAYDKLLEALSAYGGNYKNEGTNEILQAIGRLEAKGPPTEDMWSFIKSIVSKYNRPKEEKPVRL